MDDSEQQHMMQADEKVIRQDLLHAASKHQVCIMVCFDVARGQPGETLTNIRDQGATEISEVADANGDAVFTGIGPMLVDFDGVRVQFPVDTPPEIIRTALLKVLEHIEKAGDL